MSPADERRKRLRLQDGHLSRRCPHIHGVGDEHGVRTQLCDIAGVVLESVPTVDGVKVR
jgi:hypothetical protein